MKKILYIIIFLLVSGSAFGTNYYLSNAGNDTNSGTSSLQPWKTITQLNAALIQPGDSILFECGSIFRGEIIVNNSGDDLNKIYFGKYGTGNLPVISGAEELTGWTNFAGSIYNAPLTQVPAHLFTDDKQMTIARYPNTGFLLHQAGLGNTGFVDTVLIQADGFWNGANVRMRTGDGVWEVRIVDTFSNDTIRFQLPTEYGIGSDYGYYLDNLLSLLDTTLEWYYDSLTGNIYFIAPGNVDPSSLNVEASVYDYGIRVQNGSSNIQIENIQFEKQRKTGIYFDGFLSGAIVSSCTFRLQGENGISNESGSLGCAFEGNNFHEINGLGIQLSGSHNNFISQNHFKHIGLIPGYGTVSSVNNLIGIKCDNSDSVTISYNDFDSIGSMGIFAGITNAVISKNIFNHCVIHTNSCGSIFLYGPQENKSILESNIILNTVGNTLTQPFIPLLVAGIYCYAVTENVLQNNTIAYATCGILVAGNSSNNFIHQNVVYGCSESQLKIYEGGVQGSTSGNTVTGNVFYSLNEAADVVKLTSSFSSFTPAQFDSNYYFNPYAYHIFKTELSPDGSAFPTYYTLEQWQNRNEMDLNSKATFFYRSRFKVTDTIGNNLITNSFFTNNFDGWSNGTPGIAQMLLDNATPLDFGCLKIGFLFSLPDTTAGIFYTGFSMDSGKFYQWHISNYSTKAGNTVIKIKNNTDFGYVATPAAFPFNNIRNDYSYIIEAHRFCAPCVVSAEINGLDSLVWIDNLTLFPVNTFFQVPEKKSRLFVNPTDNSITVDLGDSIFFNLDQIQISGSFSLPPFSSVILVFDSSLITSADYVPEQVRLKLFPNPASRGNSVNAFLNENGYASQLQIFDLQGKLILDENVSGHQVLIDIPQELPEGIYVVKFITNDLPLIGKLVVQ